MADKKISALTGATTPLAGTEVLPIVQSGSTVKVAVSNLTAGRSVSMLGCEITNSGATGGVLRLSNSDTDQTVGDVIGKVEYYSADADDPEVKAYVRAVVLDAFGRDGYLSFGTTATGAAVVEQMTLGTTGDATLTTGNLVIGTSGKGIDFSATASGSGTMTSELLADYEEGTWTPVLAFGGASVGVTYAAQNGAYTKIGRLVTGRFVLVLSSKGSSTGVADISGLPFTVGTDIGSAVTEFASNFVTSPPTQGYCTGATTTIVPWAIGLTGHVLLSDTNFANNTRLDMWFQYFV